MTFKEWFRTQYVPAQKWVLGEENGAGTGVWVYLTAGHQRLFYYAAEEERITKERVGPSRGQAPMAIIRGGTNTFANGKFRWNTHGHRDELQPCIEDYASVEGRTHWPDYHIERDASGKVVREGPRPFKTEADRLRYEELTGLRSADAGYVQSQEHPWEADNRKYAHLNLEEVTPKEFLDWGNVSPTEDEVDNVEYG